MIGAIEAGGTKFVCAVANEQLTIVDSVTFPTRHPKETFVDIFTFFDKHKINALGIGCFGPIDINPHSSTYGYITSTPKLAWQHIDVIGQLTSRYALPCAWNTDVNVAAYGEFHLGAGKNSEHLIYITVGTGIGGGLIYKGQIFQTSNHGELGHMYIRPLADDRFKGCCPFHHNCLEGLASGPAIEKRWGMSGKQLTQEHPAWEFEAHYLAQAMVNYTLMFAPDKIVIGGGVMNQPHLLGKIKLKFNEYMNHYRNINNLDDYLVLPELGNQSAIFGGLLLAKELL